MKVDRIRIDAAIAVGRSREGGMALIRGEGRVLDIEILGADLERALGSLAAVDPHGSAIGDGDGGGNAVVGRGESDTVHYIPQLGVVGQGEDDLEALDMGAGYAGDGIDGLGTEEEGELVALVEGLVVEQDSLRKVRNSSAGVDDKSAETDVAYEEAGGVLGHVDAGEGASSDLVGGEDGAAVEADGLGDIDLDDVEVGLDEGVEDGHLGREVFVAAAEHGVELFVDGAEVGPLGTAVHLSCRTAGGGGLYGGLADHRAVLGLAVEELAYLAADFGVDTVDFCHLCFPFFLRLNNSCVSSLLVRHVHLTEWLRKTRQKYCELEERNRGLSGCVGIKEDWDG